MALRKKNRKGQRVIFAVEKFVKKDNSIIAKDHRERDNQDIRSIYGFI
jgi:hypothetical protein